jgi:hypothetical protein
MEQKPPVPVISIQLTFSEPQYESKMCTPEKAIEFSQHCVYWMSSAYIEMITTESSV